MKDEEQQFPKNSEVESILTKLSNKFSKYSPIVRTIAWMLKFRSKKRNVGPDLSVEEFEKAEKSLFYLIQKDAFTEDKRKSELKTLEILIDNDGLFEYLEY